MVREDGPDAHSAGVQGRFPAKTAERSMTVYYVDLLPNDNVAEYREKRENGRKRGRAIDDEERHVVNFEAVGQVADAGSILIRVRYDYHLVASINKSLRQLIYVTFDASWLGEEEIADHSDIVRWMRHFGDTRVLRRSLDG